MIHDFFDLFYLIHFFNSRDLLVRFLYQFRAAAFGDQLIDRRRRFAVAGFFKLPGLRKK